MIPTTTHRLVQIFKQKGFQIFLALDIPNMKSEIGCLHTNPDG